MRRSIRKLITIFGDAIFLLIICAMCSNAVGQRIDEVRSDDWTLETHYSSPGLISEPSCENPSDIFFYHLGEIRCISGYNCSEICRRYKGGMCCWNGTNSCICCAEDQFFVNGRCNYTVRFMVAAQIALGAALVLAVAALSFLVWKMCFRNNLAVMQGRNRVRAFCGLPQSPRRSSNTGSLNSIQTYVVRKMRDRPPRYEDDPPQLPPCYNEVVLSPDSHSLTRVFPSTIIYTTHMNPTFGFEAAPPYSVTASFPQEELGAASSEDSTYPHNVAMGLPLTRIRENEANAQSSINGARANKTSTNEGSSYSHDSSRNSRRPQRLYDEACGGFDNPGFVRDVQEQHM